MGGICSGRRRYSGSKKTTGDYLALDSRYLQREGLLEANCSRNLDWSRNDVKVAAINIRAEVGRVILSYCHRRGDGEWTHEEYAVSLKWTPCNYGGRRAWFICPARGCGRRVAILYGGSIFACRFCHQLAYQSQRQTDSDRARTRAEMIRKRLGWEQGILNGSSGKPKGMHWRTYQQLTHEYIDYAGVYLADVDIRLNRLNRLLGVLAGKG
ncbi:hypothetical protein F6R98_18935 [Candidatus Methylospira mobilis]|uniref:Uncharacterized protein n=1 Tax=Candidatus Methylospira mobilis TaxID=1808979 RepID=A0A5Q0BQT8_9GAMM|nr:hypothetical protein [Candidatus Methylospira mobilis]QFY44448.1 hypothetical protein F6R98_18935 [Candidatus Methylospira mobilis]